MKKLNSSEIRRTFLEYFQEKEHKLISGSSLIPANDPTLLFINSGMAPLKKYFLGKAKPDCPRMCNVQPCIRTKDIDDVGDRHHLTLFEMMGSWSIGHYYKDQAVELAYELLVKRLGFDPNRLYVTVYKGNKKLGLPADEISAKAWEKVGIKRDRIVYLGEDNFWGPPGETGPCGPCTEVFFDTGDKFGPAYKPGEEFETTKRYIEIWNAGVFMELNKNADGTFEPLPLKSVDTGSGVERMAMVMNGFDTVYETDSMKPIVDQARVLFSGPTMEIEQFRVLADHMRASSFILSEGVIPSNEGRGYIPRRLLRKCVALAVRAESKSTELIKLADTVIKTLADAYPHLDKNKNIVRENIKREIEEFEPIIRNGLKILEAKLTASNDKLLSGTDTFEVVATHGLPLDIIISHARENGFDVDQEAYAAEFEKHQAISRQGVKSGAKPASQSTTIDFEEFVQGLSATEFTGYDNLQDKGKILKIAIGNSEALEVNADQVFMFVTDRTPFYAESGGQVGDTGIVTSASGKATITDTQKCEKVWIHKAVVKEGCFKVGSEVELVVDSGRRLRIRRNHSATHLMNSALRQVLGDHVVQKGSHVDDNRLRFDFQHFSAMQPEEVLAVENLVNQWIWDNNHNDSKVKSFDEAVEDGALALVGENYGDKVRVVSFGAPSTELCGGTHVESTGEIGVFLVASESSIARGVRRIEGLTGAPALKLIQERFAILKQASEAINSKPSELVNNVMKIKKQASEKAKAGANANISSAKFSFEKTFETGKGHKAFIARLDEDSSILKTISEQKLQKKEAEIVCITGVQEGNARLLVMIDKPLSKTVNANHILKPLLEVVEGRGGGKPDFAQGGGKNIDKIATLLNNAEQVINEAVAKS